MGQAGGTTGNSGFEAMQWMSSMQHSPLSCHRTQTNAVIQHPVKIILHGQSRPKCNVKVNFEVLLHEEKVFLFNRTIMKK